ncbi:MAG: rod shape-determining protein MreD [Candidatus Cloacimonetes bacterium]|nr:rod shape-determining protein MreD [Candidatus Cloacimonadota bacterium]
MQILRMSALGLAVLYLQLLVLPHITLWHAAPNLLLAWVLLAAMKLPRTPTLLLAFLLGLAYDLTLPLSLGMHATILLLLAELINRLHNSWSKNSPFNVMLAVFLLSVGWEIAKMVFHALAGHGVTATAQQLTIGLLWQTVSGTLALYILLLLDRIRFHVQL